MQTPRWIWITLAVLAGCGWHLNGQTSIDLTRQGRLASGTTLPAQCAVGQVFFKSNAPAGANLYTCVAQDSWAAAGLNQIDAAGTPLTVRPTLNFGGGATCVDNSGANRTDCTFSGGGSGFVALTSGAGAPAANCAAPSSSNLAVYLDTASQDEWWCSAANTWKKMLSVTGTGPYGVTGGTGVAPSAPSSGVVACYFDSTTNTQVCLDSSGNAFTMIKGAASVSHQFVANVDTSGIQHLAQPAFSDLSGATTYKTITCQPGLGDGLNTISAGTYLMSACLNDKRGCLLKFLDSGNPE
jgi:hypothetical protein